MKTFHQIREMKSVQEGTWSVPDSYEKLADLQKRFLDNKISASEKNTRKLAVDLYNMYGDDDFYDELGEYMNNPDPKVDLRDIIIKYLKDWIEIKNHKITKAPEKWVLNTTDEDVDIEEIVSEGKPRRGKGNIKKPKGKMVIFDGRQEEQMKKLAAKLKPKIPKLDIKGKLKALGKKITDPAKKLAEGKMVWDHKIPITDGTMQMGIFDSDKEKAMEAARQLIFFLRKNKKTKIGKADPEQNDSNAEIAKYSEEVAKLVFDDKLLDDLEPNGNNQNQKANEIVLGRLRDLGVRIK